MNEQGAAKREYDLVVWGATGYTGVLVAQYLARFAPTSLRWALGGRSEARLKKVLEQLELSQAPAPDVVVADSFDRAALDRMTERARVVISTVGPFAKYGSELVASCVASRTHYCDITGETHWVQRMIERHHETAQKDGTWIVPCCGFDSIPSDLGTFMMQEEARARYGVPCTRVRYYVKSLGGKASGGTVASIIGLIDEAKANPGLAKKAFHPYSLNPDGEKDGPDGRDQVGIGKSMGLEGYTAPFVMAGINTRIVRRTNSLLEHRYGRDFSYHEAMRFPGGSIGWLRAAQATAAVAGMLAALSFVPLRKVLLGRVIPEPGQGPTEAERVHGHFAIDLVGEGVTPDGDDFRLFGRVVGNGDPGYAETSKMLAESALALAFDACDGPTGVVTPAAAMGAKLLERLRAAGLRFEVDQH